MFEKDKEIGRRPFTPEERRAVFDKVGNKCMHCGRILPTQMLTIDHMVPLDRGGTNTLYNLLPLCETCNNEKSNQLLQIDWAYKYLPDSMRREYETSFFTILSLNDNGRLIPYNVKHYVFRDTLDHFRRKMAKNGHRSGFTKMILPKHYSMHWAYEGDASEIAGFCKKMKQKGVITHSSEDYCNEFIVLDTIRNGEGYILRNNEGEICGAYLFEPVEKLGVTSDAFKMYEKQTVLKPGYVSTMALTAPVVRDNPESSQILSDFTLSMVKRGMIPMHVGYGRAHNVYWTEKCKRFDDDAKICIIYPDQIRHHVMMDMRNTGGYYGLDIRDKGEKHEDLLMEKLWQLADMLIYDGEGGFYSYELKICRMSDRYRGSNEIQSELIGGKQ